MKQTVLPIIKDSWPTLIIFLSIVAIIRIAYLKHNKKKIVFYKELYFLFFITYILLLYQLVTYREIGSGGLNLIPFTEILRYEIGSSGFYNQVIGNVVLFVPFGFFVTDYVNITKLRTIFLMTFFTSGIIEVTQYFIGRSFDTDDIILNVVGGILGFLIYVALSAIKKHLPGIFQKDWFYSIISFIFVIFVILYFLGYFRSWGF